MKVIHAMRVGQLSSNRVDPSADPAPTAEPRAAIASAVIEVLESRRHLSVTVVSNKLVPAKTTIAAVSKPIAKPVAKPVTPVKVIPVKTAIPTATPIAGVQLVKKAAGKTTNSQVATPLGSPGPVGLTPAQVRHAYGLDSVSFNGIVGDGTGQTIAIVDAFDNPKFVSSTDPNYATSDLAIFSTAMGLPNPPSFTKLDQNGGTNYPTTTNAAWAAEVALNVEWAHAMAPMANIVLVEAKSANYADLLSAAANTARNLPGVSVVSMSFGTDGGFFNENVYDQYFTTPAGHQGVTFVAASGDHGAVLASGGTTYTGSYPAESPNVVAVGGTSLTLNAGEYASESGWTGSGGGISKFESKPAYQTGLTQSATQRTIPDVSITADPNSGVAVYDSFNNPDAGAGWYGNNFGGTSIAAPMWAGLLAVTNQARVANGLGTLNGSTQTLPRLYQVSQSNFHDITTGNNKADGVHGYLAGAGYDLVTGRGTPIANLLVPALVGGTSSGMAYIDKNSDGVFNNTDVKLVGGIIYADGNNNGIYDAGEITAITDANGLFTLDAPAGFPIRQGTPGYTDLSTNNPIGTTTNGVISGLVVPVFPTTYTNSGAGTRSITLRPLTQSSATQITLTNVVNGVTSNDFYTIATSRLPRLDFVSAGNTTLTIELTFGNGLLATTNTYTGAAGDVVLVKAATSGGAATFANTGITLGTKTMSFIGTNPDLSYLGTTAVDALTISGVTSGITFVGGGGVSVDAVNVTSGTPSLKTDLGGDGTKVNFTASGGTTTLIGPQHLNGVTLQNAAVANLRRPATTAVVLRTPSISINSAGGAALNLENNALILDYTTSSPNAAVAAWLASGYAAGAWTGGGIRSSTAAADATKLRGVGSNEASTALNLSGSATTSYLGETVDATTLLIRSTLAGDADLSGAVDFNDFLVLQNNFGQPGGTYAQADFNYDGVDDFNDFLMLQNGFNQIA